MTGAELMPVSAAMALRNGPSTVPGCTMLPIKRVAKQRVAPAEQGEIDSPGVNADAIDWPGLAGAEPQGLEHLTVQTQYVPVQRVERRHTAVGETMHDFELDFLSVEQAEDAASG